MFQDPVVMATEDSIQTLSLFSHLLSLIDQSNSVNRQTTFPQSESDFC